MVNSTKYKNLLQLSALIITIVVINIITSYIYIRIDLTEEKRFSLSKSTINIIKNLDDYMYIKVYLEDDNLPSDFMRLNNESKLMLNEFSSYSNLFEYEFINLENYKNETDKIAIFTQLEEKGIMPTSIETRSGNQRTEKIIFPGAIIHYKGKEHAVNLLKNSTGTSPLLALNNSVEELEYTFANAIKKIKQIKKQRIAFTTGHGELDKFYVEDITKTLKNFYQISRFNLNEFEIDSTDELTLINQINRLQKNQLLIIAKPSEAFKDRDKFIIDQYIMNGGKVIWLIDGVQAEMDSLALNNEINAFPFKSLNIDDQLFKYGIRLNNNLIQDISCAPILVPISYNVENVEWGLDNWYYMPLLQPASKHPITKNISPVKGEFTSSIDTVYSLAKKTFLLHSSPFSKKVNTPKLITLDILNKSPEEKNFNDKYIPSAVLLEGVFESIFKNRLTPKNTSFKTRDISKETQMIFIADGDIIKNQVHQDQIIPLGIDKWTYSRTGHQYGNKEFMLNCIDYLMDETDLINARNKNIELRLLDSKKVSDNSLFWKLINTLSPILLIIFFAIFQIKIRMHRHETT